MDPDIKRINDQLSLIIKYSSPDEKFDKQILTDATNKIEADYKSAVDVLADQKASADEKKLAKDVTDAINKNLPNITKGVLSAASAFKAGDYINGSAAIMDICASGAAMIGSLSAAAGPFGAVFGAVFSMVGQLLTYFGPKQLSLTKQIEAAMRGLDAETKLQEAKAEGQAVEEYWTTIYGVKSSLPELLKKPLPEERKGLEAYGVALGKDVLKIQKSFDKVSAKFGKWNTAAWLMDEKKQDMEKWPEILGVFCRVYSDSLLTNMALASIVNKHKELVDQRLEETHRRGPNYKELKEDLKDIHKSLKELLIVSEALPELWDDGNKQMQRFLEEIRPVAQDRGLFVHMGNDWYLYAATGRSAIQSDSWKNLPIGHGGRGHRFSITVPKKELGSLNPQYDIFFCQHWRRGGGDMEHGRVSPSPVGISGQGEISTDKFSDVWALPGRDQGASFIYAAHDGETGGSVKLFVLDAKNKLTEGNWWPPTKAGVVNVRAVTHPPATLPDDPDKDGLPPGSLLLGGVDHDNSIIYGALRSSSEIYVDQSNTRCYVPSPWETYSGIDVDPYYLWVFRPQGFACATHASVISCILGKRETPRWMEHSPTKVLGDQTSGGSYWWVNGQARDAGPPLKGLISLSPCTDGTIYASMYTRTVSQYEGGLMAKDSLGSYTTLYSIDLKAGKLNVDPWVKCGGEAYQVQKMPIPCWSLFESLDADLKSKLKIQSET